MQLYKEQVQFCRNCCNEIQRGFKVRPNFETHFGIAGDSVIQTLEQKLDETIKTQSEDNMKLELTVAQIILLIKIIVLTTYELDWELPIRTNLNESEVQILIANIEEQLIKSLTSHTP